MIRVTPILLAVLAAIQRVDLNGDQIIDSGDMAIVLAQWGLKDTSADFNSGAENNAGVDAFDLAHLLGMWAIAFGVHDSGDGKTRYGYLIQSASPFTRAGGVAYRRYTFTDPATGWEYSIDQRIEP